MRLEPILAAPTRNMIAPESMWRKGEEPAESDQN
jgi:hypothetical protein